MSLNQKFILFSVLTVTGTCWLSIGLLWSQHAENSRAEAVRSSTNQARQVVGILGSRLLEDASGPLAPMPRPRHPEVDSILNRVLDGDPSCLALFTVANQDSRAVVVHDVRRAGTARPLGSVIELTDSGHRANRTGTVQSHIVQRGAQEIVQTFAPITDAGNQVVGLLVAETDLAGMIASPAPWTGLLLGLLVGLVACAWLVLTVGRPLARLQDQLVVKENLSPMLCLDPSDLLREVTRVIDKAHGDRSYYEVRLKQQDQQQKQLGRMRDEVIANTVHELRTPLTSIIASLEIVRDHREIMTVEETLEFLDQATVASKHMMFVVNDMLDSAAVEAGKIKMEIEKCNLAKILDDARRSMEMVAAGKRMLLDVPRVDPDVHVMADNSRVLQVIFNLVSNSVKYSPAGSNITLRTWTNDKSVVLEIEDEGESIPLAMRPKLFTRFSKLDREGDQHVQSSGIGLYLSKKLVELMHGTIGYREAEGGKGSIFWFTLPVASKGAVIEPAAV